MLIFALSKNKTYTEGKSMIFSVLIVFLIVEEFSKKIITPVIAITY